MASNDTQSRPRPVLMMPLRRCGSHALRLRLNLSPDFYAPYPLHIIDFMPNLARYGDLNVDRNYFQLIVDLVALQNASMVRWEDVVLDPVHLFDTLKNRKRTIHHVIWEMLFTAGRQHSAKVVMDKSLDSVEYAHEFFDMFDDMLFLNVVRDPRAQVASMNKAIIHDFDTLLNAYTWRQAHDKAQDVIKSYPDRVLTIRFEDFIENEAAVLHKVCEFLGIEFSRSMLDVGNSREAQEISKLSALWESNASKPIKANMDKFKNTLSDEDILIIETITKDHMKLYGYEFMTPANATITEKMRQTAMDRSTVESAANWRQLQNDRPQDYILRRARADVISQVARREVGQHNHAKITNSR